MLTKETPTWLVLLIAALGIIAILYPITGLVCGILGLGVNVGG